MQTPDILSCPIQVFHNNYVANIRSNPARDAFEIDYEMSVDEINEFVEENSTEILQLIRACIVCNNGDDDLDYEAFERLWAYSIENDLPHISYMCQNIELEYDCYRFGYKRSKPHTRTETSNEMDAIQLWLMDMIAIVAGQQTFDFHVLNVDHEAEANQWYANLHYGVGTIAAAAAVDVAASAIPIPIS